MTPPLQIVLNPALETIGTALGSAIVASLSFWLAKRKGTDEPFKPEKAAPVVVASFLVALALIATGQATTQSEILTALPLFVGPIAVWLQESIQRYKTGHSGFQFGDDRTRQR